MRDETSKILPHPASFRDAENQVFEISGSIYRALSPLALTHWEKAAQAEFVRTLQKSGHLIDAVRADIALPEPRLGAAPWTAALEHPRLAFISYPYEWCFGMLKTAALLTLDILERGLEGGWILKDCSSFNVQWRGTTPVFIDVCSLTPWVEGQPWMGYRQFCELFLNPLMLTAYRRVPFQPWLRGSLEGLFSADCAKLLGLKTIFRTGAFKHVFLHAALQRHAGLHQEVTHNDIKETGINSGVLLANIRNLRSVVNALTTRKQASHWTAYKDQRNYSEDEYAQKLDAVRQWVARKPRKMAWDIGCNLGDFSRIAAAHAETVLAFDNDPQVIELFYQTLRVEGPRNILPLVMDIANPSPSQGWNGRERSSLIERGAPDIVLALAVVHHLAIAANIPLPELIRWFAQFKAELLIEFVDREDERVRDLLRTKDISHADYTRDNFERLLRQFFHIRETRTFRQGKRLLYACDPL